MTPEPLSPAEPQTLPPGPTLGPILALALLGGLILNLMPCVLPVLSLKLLSVLRHGGGDPRRVRSGFLASAAGILFSFLVLALILIALKTAGATVGWGIQFQHPLFLVVMALVVTLFAANLWDLFEIPLPRLVGDAAARRTGGGIETWAKAFVGGAFATVLATPCSAPFLGTALGFALARGPGEILAVFCALGLGMALPYCAVAAFPRVATILPRPGRWMVVVRRGLGLALGATALWLLWVLGWQTPFQAAYIAGLLALLVCVLALRVRLNHRPRRLLGAGAATLIGATLLVAPLDLEPPAPSAPSAPTSTSAMATASASASASASATTTAAGAWQPFDRARLRQLVAAGNVVFVDVTAAWCITCLANKRLVLDRGAVAARLRDPAKAIVTLRADWTRPNPAISQYLAEFNRFGVPFNAVYGPNAPEGWALPELLTPSVVLDALDRAAGPIPGSRS